jgi:hypothetical protein
MQLQVGETGAQQIQIQVAEIEGGMVKKYGMQFIAQGFYLHRVDQVG